MNANRTRMEPQTPPLIVFVGALMLVSGCGDGPGGAGFGGDAELLSVCPGADTLEGIDVSYWQGPSIDWAAVAAAGKRFAFIRLNHGTNNIDSYFERNWKGARDNGIIRGAYQFFVPSDDVAAQAQIVIDRLFPLIPGDLPPVLDVEEADDAGAAALSAKVRQWMEIVEPALGVKPIIYTGRYFWDTEVKSAEFAKNPLWVANWEVSCPNLPAPWTSWAFWQHSATGRVPGISGDVDLDTFNGTIGDLQKFAVQEPNPVCGDGICNGAETRAACADDCAPLDFITPKDGETVSNPVAFRVTADAAVARVNYFAETWPIGSSSDPASQFEAAWTFGTLGVRQISAEGLDKFGARVAAAGLTITVAEDPGDAGADAGQDDSGVADGGGDETDAGHDAAADAGFSPDTAEDVSPDAAPDDKPDAGPQSPCGAGTVLQGGRCVLSDAGERTPDPASAAPDDPAGCNCAVLAVN